MIHKDEQKIILGTAQLGMEYGIANSTGRPHLKEAKEILSLADNSSIQYLDTARAYGDSEQIIGEYVSINSSLKIITKLSPLDGVNESSKKEEIKRKVIESVQKSLLSLKRKKLEILLLHRAEHLNLLEGLIFNILLELKNKKIINEIGVSVQNPQELSKALDFEEITHVQFPFNILDHRWLESELLEKLIKRKEVRKHIRSVFLQGALTSNSKVIWHKKPFSDYLDALDVLERWQKKLGFRSLRELSLAYVRSYDWIDGYVLGVETAEQLEGNISSFNNPTLNNTQLNQIKYELPTLPEKILNPAKWKL